MTEELAAVALASICDDSRGLSVERLLLGRLRHRAVILGMLGPDSQNLKAVPAKNLAKDRWLASHGVDIEAMSQAVEQYLSSQHVIAPVAHAISRASLAKYLTDLGHNSDITHPAPGLVHHTLSLLLNEIARVAQAAGIQRMTFFVDDFYKLIYKASEGVKVSVAGQIRQLAVEGPYVAINEKLFNWVAVMHNHIAPNFNPYWEQVRMHQVATLNRSELEDPLELNAIPLSQGPDSSRSVPLSQRTPRSPSKIYPFNQEALAAITRIAGEQIGDTKYDPGILLECAFKVACDALLLSNPAPIGADFVDHVLKGSPLPLSGNDDNGGDEDPDFEVLMDLIECTCDCHSDTDTALAHDVMARKDGKTGLLLSYRCVACNAPLEIQV